MSAPGDPSGSDLTAWRGYRIIARMMGGRCSMVEALKSKHEAIAAACQRHSVVRLEAFGSALRSDFVPEKSDVDLLVEFEPLESYALVDAYFGLLDDLRSLLGEVDLVMVGAVRNPYLARAIEREKQLLYAA
jgi:predicted nucleotidyltransferase